MQKHKKSYLYYQCLIFIVITVIFIIFQLAFLQQIEKIQKSLIRYAKNGEDFREIDVSNNVISFLKKNDKNNYLERLTLLMIGEGFHLRLAQAKKTETEYKMLAQFIPKEDFMQIYKQYVAIFGDLKCFPVLEDKEGKETLTFDNSWMSPRSYGGERGHEGTDIMTSNNKAGYFSIVSVSDGIIEKKGWLEKGGYRLGIRGENGAYFYYAHLQSYAEGLEEGDKIKAGQIIGKMGNTGYSKVEGTTGNFDVHLHFGIYLGKGEKEISVNPYWVLAYLTSSRKSPASIS